MHRNTTNIVKNARAAINRHLKDIGRSIDIVYDTEFKSANYMLSAKFKFNLHNGLSKLTHHHPTISTPELMNITTYLIRKEDSVALRFIVWYLLGIYFVRRGVEFHHQLSINSFKFESDERGSEFLSISHEKHKKTHQG